MPHHRARFTAFGRWTVARLVIEDGETFARAAARGNVSRSTVWEWVARWRAASEVDRVSLACLPSAQAVRAALPARFPTGRQRGSARCVSGRAGVLGGSRTSLGSTGRTRRCTGCCNAPAARDAPRLSARR